GEIAESVVGHQAPDRFKTLLGVGDWADFDVAVFDFFVVVLEGDMALGEAAVLGGLFELAELVGFEPVFGADVVFDDFDVIEVVFDVVADDDDARVVPLTNGLGGVVRVGGVHVVRRAGVAVGVVFGVGMLFVVEDLVLDAGVVEVG